MKHISIPSLALLASAVLPCLAQSSNNTRVTYDTTYNNKSYPLSGTACSNGVNGLEYKWPLLGDVPGFPNVGGIPDLVWDSPLCGTCWQLNYTAPNGSTQSIAITAVDGASTFNIAENAFSQWAGSLGIDVGSVNTTAAQVSTSSCGGFVGE